MWVRCLAPFLRFHVRVVLVPLFEKSRSFKKQHRIPLFCLLLCSSSFSASFYSFWAPYSVYSVVVSGVASTSILALDGNPLRLFYGQMVQSFIQLHAVHPVSTAIPVSLFPLTLTLALLCSASPAGTHICGEKDTTCGGKR